MVEEDYNQSQQQNEKEGITQVDRPIEVWQQESINQYQAQVNQSHNYKLGNAEGQFPAAASQPVADEGVYDNNKGYTHS